jgi:hypothetical protein
MEKVLIFDIKLTIRMPRALNLNNILSEVKKLGKDEQLSLLEKLAQLIRSEGKKKSSAKISSISGVGSEIWKGVNIDEYLEQERQW